MRSNQTFSVSFFTRKKKKQPEQALLYARITVNGKPLEISLKRCVPLSKWNQSAAKMQGGSIESQLINKKIDETKTLLYKAYDSLLNQDRGISAHLIKDRYLGTDQKHSTLINLLDYHRQKMSAILNMVQ